MKERTFTSEAGSSVRTFGKHGLAYDICIDWFEEGACADAHWEFNLDFGDPRLYGACDC